MERGGDQPTPKSALHGGRLEVSPEPGIVERTDVVVLVIGTPIDEFMDRSTRIYELAPRLRKGALVVLRSTVYPGTAEFVESRLKARRGGSVVFYPGRVAKEHTRGCTRGTPAGVHGHVAAADGRDQPAPDR